MALAESKTETGEVKGCGTIKRRNTMKYGDFYNEKLKRKEENRKVGASIGCIILTVWGLGILLSISAGLGLAWGLVHFISKWW